MSAGAAKAALVEQLTPLLPGIFTYLIGDTTLGRDERSRLVDVALTHRADSTEYEHSDQVRTFFEASYSDFLSLRDERYSDAARRAVQFIAGTGAVIPTVVELSAAARAALIKACAYAITTRNLEVLAETDNIALDRLAKADRDIYGHALGNLDAYFQSNHESQGTRWTVESSAMFIGVLQDVARLRKPDFGRLVNGASPECMIDDLGDAPEGAWPVLVGTGRIPPTFANVRAYVEWAGGIDEWLAALLASAREVVDANGEELDARRELATTIVNAREQLPDPALRAQIAGSLQPGALEAQSVGPESGELIALLIEKELLNDDEETFHSRLMVDWRTLEHAITRSSNYAELIGPQTLQATYIAELMQSSKVADDIKNVVLEALDEFAGGAPKAGHQAMAAYALRSGLGLRADQIETLRRGGAHQATVAGLLAAAGKDVSLDELRQTLRNMGGDYARIADKGNRQAQLADTQAHQAILRRLQDGGIVSTIKPDRRKSNLRVHMKR
ncbi:hypothetical protein ABZ570_03400 [Micromonospora sp. NPDC007271]|uniref:hypothetical protein n=1 Tax=Micromonospora sp. NPDC007271 TaxID=3154587 RepID=UPI0033E5739B